MAVRRYTENIPAYPVEINYMKEKNSFVARIPDLKYCRAIGQTPELALEELQKSLKYTIKKAQENGIKLPKPSKFVD
ncbi:MAG: hypothetical protein HeimC2_11870 [Candidatus Heimdallarchaeota archaeon LC_2]|nr:MAG: hypothetical protein HeimC2_11870 [Candidatus Heimdallarchaeota archaeon LC_2]